MIEKVLAENHRNPRNAGILSCEKVFMFQGQTSRVRSVDYSGILSELQKLEVSLKEDRKEELNTFLMESENFAVSEVAEKHSSEDHSFTILSVSGKKYLYKGGPHSPFRRDVGGECTIFAAIEIGTCSPVVIKKFSEDKTEGGDSSLGVLRSRHAKHEQIEEVGVHTIHQEYVECLSASKDVQRAYLIEDYNPVHFFAALKQEPSLKYKAVNDILSSVHQLHEGGWVHCDLNGKNVLFTEKPEPQSREFVLIDYGFARKSTRRGGEIAGTPRFMAPEVLLENTKRDFSMADLRKVDDWNVGCLVYSALTGEEKTPFSPVTDEIYQNSTKKHTFWNINKLKSMFKLTHEHKASATQDRLNTAHKELSAKLACFSQEHPTLVKIAMGMMQPNPKKRMTVKEALSQLLTK